MPDQSSLRTRTELVAVRDVLVGDVLVDGRRRYTVRNITNFPKTREFALHDGGVPVGHTYYKLKRLATMVTREVR